MIVTVVICIAPLLVAAAKVGQAAPISRQRRATAKRFRLGDYCASMLFLSGTTTDALTGKALQKRQHARLQQNGPGRRRLVHDSLFGPGKQW